MGETLIIRFLRKLFDAQLRGIKLSNRLATRSFSSDILAFIIPRVVLSSPHNAILYAGTLGSSGTIPAQGRTAKEMPIGAVTVLNL